MKRLFRGLYFVLAVLLLSASVQAAVPAVFNNDAQAQIVSRHKDNVLHIKIAQSSGITLGNGVFVGGNPTTTSKLNVILNSAAKVKVEKIGKTSAVNATQQSVNTALDKYYRITFSKKADMASIISQLKALGVIDTAYAEPTPAPAPASPSYVSLENYLTAAPNGVDANKAATYSGGAGDNVKIVDIEYSWNTQHEDLTKAGTALIAHGTPVDPFNDNNHGTAVLGEMVADNNSVGVTGIANKARLSLINANSSEYGYDPAGALNLAAANVSAGDVVIVEQQTWGPSSDPNGFVPVEWIPEVYDAIKALTAKGVIVVEPAGNGNQNLDNTSLYGTSFPMGKADSGALIVGAGENCASGSPKLSRLSFSNYGNRVNLQGPGDCVTSTGWYGDLYSAGGVNAYYTSSFNGTSSATPVVAASAADLSSAYKASHSGAVLTPAQVRDILSRDSTAQNTSVSGQIGPLPDLAKAMVEINATPLAPKDTTPPSVPQNLKAVLNSSHYPVLSWSPSTDNVKVSSYRIYRNGSYLASTTGTSYTNQTAKRYTTYTYQVAAVDSSGNISALSAKVSIYTH